MSPIPPDATGRRYVVFFQFLYEMMKMVTVSKTKTTRTKKTRTKKTSKAKAKKPAPPRTNAAVERRCVHTTIERPLGDAADTAIIRIRRLMDKAFCVMGDLGYAIHEAMPYDGYARTKKEGPAACDIEAFRFCLAFQDDLYDDDATHNQLEVLAGIIDKELALRTEQTQKA